MISLPASVQDLESYLDHYLLSGEISASDSPSTQSPFSSEPSFSSSSDFLRSFYSAHWHSMALDYLKNKVPSPQPGILDISTSTFNSALKCHLSTLPCLLPLHLLLFMHLDYFLEICFYFTNVTLTFMLLPPSEMLSSPFSLSVCSHVSESQLKDLTSMSCLLLSCPSWDPLFPQTMAHVSAMTIMQVLSLVWFFTGLPLPGL